MTQRFDETREPGGLSRLRTLCLVGPRIELLKIIIGCLTPLPVVCEFGVLITPNIT